ncbi:hypothetical protein [Streptomyces sp. C8S0]|uniref:hypothetical protein n=1 Tax=Streptomyces sp. C8S0 TaxID=2585716 RepID=UPI0018671028|nr:hypothetical protein [Streptomyces sp. C8S0]
MPAGASRRPHAYRSCRRRGGGPCSSLASPHPPKLPEDSTVLLKDSFTEKCLDSDSGGKVYTNECHTDNGYQKWQWIPEARAR